jgi:beta-lactamase regulating signal transducer with metallopeptidase domain
MLCILYANAIGFLLGTIGVLVERLMPAHFARRWIWCIVLPVSVGLPGYYRYHHSLMVAPAESGMFAGVGTGILMQTGSVDAFIGRAWLVSIVVLALWALVNAGWVAQMLRRSAVAKDGVASNVDAGAPVIITDTLGPATVGVWRSRVVLPRWVLALPDVQRRYIVRHEEEHRRSHDTMLLFLASLPAILIPWNLALWWQLRRLRLAVEMDCDTRVVSALGDAQAYGRMLLAVAQASHRGPRLQPALLGGPGMLEQRLTMLLAPAHVSRALRVLLPVAASILLYFVLTTPHPMPAKHVRAHSMVTTAH